MIRAILAKSMDMKVSQGEPAKINSKMTRILRWTRYQVCALRQLCKQDDRTRNTVKDGNGHVSID